MAAGPQYAPVPLSEKAMAEEPFLAHHEDEDEESCHRCQRHARSRSRTRWLQWLLMHACIAGVYMGVLGTLWTVYAPRSGQHAVDFHEYAPARAAITYKEKHFETSYEKNPYAGEPRPEHEAVWNDLLRHTALRVSGDELQELNLTSLPLKSGGYVAQLGVFHQLHCVKWLRQWMHRDHYWPELNAVMLEERRRHIDHCLEMFRFHFQCHPDLTLGTFKWFGSHPTPGLEHHAQCADWDAFVEWQKPRVVELQTLDDLADRPTPEPWEPSDLRVILGISKGKPGEQDRYSQALVEAEPPLVKALYEAPADKHVP